MARLIMAHKYNHDDKSYEVNPTIKCFLDITAYYPAN